MYIAGRRRIFPWLYFFLGSSGLISFLQAQNVGIGAPTPTARFQIHVPAGYTSPLFKVTKQGVAAPFLIVGPTGNVGIGLNSPAQALDVSGNVQFSGALMPGGNAGAPGQVLVSQGAGTAPQWQPLITGDSVCSTAMNNYLQKWTGTKLCNSIIYDDGARLGIGTSTPDPSALVDMSTTTGGLLIPRLTTAQRNAITSPAHGLIILNIDNFCLEAYDAVTSQWYPISCPRNCIPPSCAAGSITGPRYTCSGDVVYYTAPSGCSGTRNNWTVPSGWTIVSGQGTDTLVVQAGTASGTITVSACNQCGCGAPSSFTVSSGTLPSCCPGTGVVATSYSVQQGTYSWATIPSPTCITLGDDQVSGAITLPFPFKFYGTTYNQIYISSNGFITFLAGQPSGCCSGQCIPTGSTPNGLIAGFWEDLNPSAGGTICYGTVGTAPRRVFIVQFSNVPHFGSSTATASFQIKLFECDMHIEIHCQNCISDGGNHTQGIENAAGTQAAYAPGRRCTGFSRTNDSIVFWPN